MPAPVTARGRGRRAFVARVQDLCEQDGGQQALISAYGAWLSDRHYIVAEIYYVMMGQFLTCKLTPSDEDWRALETAEAALDIEDEALLGERT